MFKKFLSILLIGVLIKIMDDYLDRDIDRIIGRWNITLVLNRSILPYSLLLMLISTYLDYNESVSFFISSYIIGMTNDTFEKLPTRLYAWQESIITLLIAIYISGLKIMVSCFLLILLIQIIDDLLDYNKEKYIINNIRNKLGFINTLLIIMIISLISLRFFPFRTIYFLTAALIIYLFFYFFEKLNSNGSHDY
ncbi:MAG: hypothetical protein ACOC1O_01245 [bacterium]